MKHIPKDFDDEKYYKLNPDVKISGFDAKQHFLEFGINESRRWFDFPESNEAFLINSGYILNDEFEIWSRPDFESIHYSDGDEVENRIAKVIEESDDISVLSNELKQYMIDWPSTYHLSSKRANLMRPLKSCLIKSHDVLEIGSGCGAITRYIGELGVNLLALEGSNRRAAITRSRTRDLENVTVLSESFDQFNTTQLFDVITLIGVLEYANLFIKSKNPHLDMLQRVRKMLKPGGKLIIAIENQFGLKYFAGFPEDHIGIPMIGIEGGYNRNQAMTFGREQLQKLIEASDFPKTEFLAPYPDYKLPVSILTSKGLLNSEFDAAALASQSVRHDQQVPLITNFSMELAYPDLISNKFGLDMANSFLVIAQTDDLETVDPQILGYHYSTDRLPEFCKETLFVEKNSNDIGIFYCSLNDRSSLSKSELLKFSVPESATYCNGDLLSNFYIEIIKKDGWTYKQLSEFIDLYLEALISMGAIGEIPKKNLNLSLKIPGKYFDVIPQNLVINNEGNYEAIDMEWEYQTDVELGYLLFRALFNTMSIFKRIGFPEKKTYETYINYTDFLKNTFQEYGFNLSYQELKHYSDLESNVQEFVSGSKVDLYDHLQNSKLFFNTSAFYNNKKEEINFLKKDILSQEKEIVILKNNNITQIKEIQVLKKEKKSREEEAEYLKNDNNNQIKEIGFLKDSLNTQKEEIEFLDNDNKRHKEEIHNLKNDKNSQKKEIGSLKDSLNTQKEETRFLTEQIKVLIEDIQVLVNEKQSLENSIKKIFSSISWKITKPIRFLKKNK